MGGCLSSAANQRRSDLEMQTSRANVVSADGQLRQYTIPMPVAQVLLNNSYNEQQQQPELMEVGNGSGAGGQQSFFLCNSDSLYYNEHIKAMDLEDQLQAGQIYFVLPSSKLRHPLSASDMAALAVKATIALQKTPSSSDSLKGRRQSKKARISPVLEEVRTTDYKFPGHDGDDNYYSNYLSDREQMTVKNRNYSTGSGIVSSLSSSRSGSVRKLQRYSSKRARTAIHAARSFKVRLSTIYEGSVLLF